MSQRITHVRKPDRYSSHDAISHYGQKKADGSIDIYEREAFIAYLEKYNEKAYVKESGDGAWCKIMNNNHIKYLQTEADSSSANNLLNLPGC